MIKFKPINESKIKRKLDLKTPANLYPKEEFEIQVKFEFPGKI